MLDLLIQIIEIDLIVDAVDIALGLAYKGSLIVADTAKDISGAVKYVRKENKKKRVSGVDPLQFKQSK